MQDERRFFIASYHEAGHILGAWEKDIPLECAEIADDGSGYTKIATEESWFWRRFRAIDQNSVRNDAFFTVCGQYGERLVGTRDSSASELDDFLVRFLARRFALDITELHNESRAFIARHVDAVARVAQELRRKRRLGRYDLALLRMDWLAKKSFRCMT